MSMKKAEAILRAAQSPDWMQVVLNQGPPCFQLERGKFCFRAERWHGVDTHQFVDLEDLLRDFADELEESR